MFHAELLWLARAIVQKISGNHAKQITEYRNILNGGCMTSEDY